MRRVFTFEPEGLSSHRGGEEEVTEQDRILRSLSIANAQLAVLAMIDSQECASGADIGFALVMEPGVLETNIEYLLGLGMIRSVQRVRKLSNEYALTALGSETLAVGTALWRSRTL